MCIITDEKGVVLSISIIPGVESIPSHLKVYFPVNITGVSVGSIYPVVEVTQ